VNELKIDRERSILPIRIPTVLGTNQKSPFHLGPVQFIYLKMISIPWLHSSFSHRPSYDPTGRTKEPKKFANKRSHFACIMFGYLKRAEVGYCSKWMLVNQPYMMYKSSCRVLQLNSSFAFAVTYVIL